MKVEINKTNLQKFTTRTININTLTNIWQQQSEGTVHEKYSKWNSEVLELAKEVFEVKVKSRKRKSKVEQILRKAKRAERQKLKGNITTEEKQMIIKKIDTINEHIVQHMKEQKSKKNMQGCR